MIPKTPTRNGAPSTPASERAWVIIGNPACRRVGFWQAALRSQANAAATVVPYADLLTGRKTLAEHVRPNSVVRFESAAENADTYRLLLKHGFNTAIQAGYDALPPDRIDGLVPARGLMVKPRQAHWGFERLLLATNAELAGRELTLLNTPDEILVQYDKAQTQSLLRRDGIPVPDDLADPKHYDDVRDRFREAGRAMVKLRHGSGGAGCVAVHWSRGRTRAIASVRVIEDRLYCAKKPTYLLDESAVAALIDRLSAEEIHAERWLPKARWNGRNFDLRVVTVRGEVTHATARLSSHVFTNLTLGNTRGELSPVVARLGGEWDAIGETARRVAGLFPQSLTLGIDVLVAPNFRSHVVLEVNAFGNLLPNLFDARGRDTYEAAVCATSEGGRSWT